MCRSIRIPFLISALASLSVVVGSCDLYAPARTPAVPADVYVAGFYANANDIMTDHACYWVNGQQITEDTEESSAFSIFVDGSNVYLAGASGDFGSQSQTACYWENSTRHDLETVYSSAVDIEKIGDTVYVLGWAVDGAGDFGNTHAVRLWTTADSGLTISKTDYVSNIMFDEYSGFLICGTDVYVAGKRNGFDSSHEAFYQKNREAPVTCPGTDVTVTGLWVDGTDVYVCGHTEDDTYYWKNGAVVDLHRDAHTSAITISGSDVYVAGFLLDVVAPTSTSTSVIYWKNNEVWRLPGDDAYAAAIQVIGEDVYAAGSAIYQSAQTACYWINGSLMPLPGPSGYFTSEAYAIAVVPK